LFLSLIFSTLKEENTILWMEDPMASENDGMAKGLIVGFLAGSIVGAAMALLYAPKTGRELRADIKKKGEEVAGDADEYVARARKKAIDIINEGKQRSDTLVSDARKRAETLMDDAQRIMSEARSKAGSEAARS
jgi:gas vesicle protein